MSLLPKVRDLVIAGWTGRNTETVEKHIRELEAVLFSLEDGLWVGVGSDHTDRRTETFNISVSKQACPKPVGPQLWRYSEVADHWDQLILRHRYHVRTLPRE